MSIFSNRSKPDAKGTIEVGWIIDPSWEGHFIWNAPQKLSRPEARTNHAKGVSVCPAINEYEARLTEISCPVDLHLRLGRDPKGEPAIIAIDGDMSTIRPQALSRLVAPVPKSEWRHPARPMLQVVTPYMFIADEPVYMTISPASYYYREKPLPGLMIGGRFPIHIWPRGLSWAFEWYDTNKDLLINRGDPWFYLNFETEDPSRRVRLVEAEMTPALREYLTGTSGVTNFVSRTFSLFDTAKRRRPKNLLVPKKR